MTDAPANTAGSEGQTLDGRYRLDALLDTEPGRSLWRATDLQNQQTVAVQLWSAASSPNDGTMTAGRLRQPEGVHPVFAGMEWNGRTTEGQAYAVHASLAGRYLDSWLASHALSAIEALELSAELSASLAALHKSGQVHGALDSNVLIVTELDGDVPALRVVDAGIDSQPAVPHGSAIKAELAKVGKLFERLAELAQKVGGADATQAMQGLATLGKRAQAVPDMTAFDSMQQLDDAVQLLATTTPGKRARNGARKVVSTMDFSVAGSGVRAAVAAGANGDALAETLEQVAVPADQPSTALSDEFFPDFDNEPPRPTGIDVTDAMSSLLIPASNLPPVDDGQMLPEIQLANAAPRPVAAPMPREPKGKKGQKTKDHTTNVAPPPVAAPPAPPTSLPSVKPQPPGGGDGGKGPAIVVAVLLLAAIVVILFVLLPGPDRPVTPLQAILASAADVQAGPEVAPEPEVVAEPDTAIAPDTAPADTAAADIAPAPDTAAASDTAPEIDTEPAKDTEPPDTAVPETIAPETIAPEAATAEIVAVETIAAPETTGPSEGDEFPGIEVPPLPGEKEFRSLDQLAASLRATETIIKRTRSDGKGAGVTALLLEKLQGKFKDGDVFVLRMRTIYYVAMQTLNKGGSEAAAGAAIVARYEAGKL